MGWGIANKKGELYPEFYTSREAAEQQAWTELGEGVVALELKVVPESEDGGSDGN